MPPGQPDVSGLFTDLYQLKMVQAMLDEGMTDPAVFSLFVRRLPARRRFLLACGTATVLEALERLRFTGDDIDYLDSLRAFSPACLDWLTRFRFTGTVHAVPDGTPVFASEPILEVIAPLPQAQIVETLVMNQVHVQTVLASKAARVVLAARGRTVIDFGARRMHGLDAAVKAARAFHVAGVHGTSNVLAGRLYGIPVAGTMAHSYIQAHDDEREAFRAFARAHPGTTVLVDTYDTLQGVRHVIDLHGSSSDGPNIAAVRLDSGDLMTLARETRRLLDLAGLQKVQIFASGGLDEHAIAALVGAGAPIDGFGVGTAMGVSEDAPSIDLVYKLAEYGGRGRTKLSTGKPVLPGRKQVFRGCDGGQANGDVIGRAGEELPGRALLRLAMTGGNRADDGDDLAAARERARLEIAALPPRVTSLEAGDPEYPVRISPALDAHHAQVRNRMSP